MAKITKIRLGKTKNLSNYRSIRFEVEADLQEGDFISSVVNELSNIIDRELSYLMQKEGP